MNRAGLLLARTLPVSDALARNYAAAGAIWRAGRIDGQRDALAMNVLMDRSAENWAANWRGCRPRSATAAPTRRSPDRRAFRRFIWTCERGRLNGQLLLAPTSPPTIQACGSPRPQ